MDYQLPLDIYLLSMLDKRLGQSKINSPRIRKYASRLGVPEPTIDFYIDNRGPEYFKCSDISPYYIRLLSSFYKNDPLNWYRLKR
ncbi:MAG TPA: hypothetical protein VI790_00390 [Candidatus Nanoarchaeia archaeon]|nr:hypothetical protein [Candidatus Nanoarchaeia archaeon]